MIKYCSKEEIGRRSHLEDAECVGVHSMTAYRTITGRGND